MQQQYPDSDNDNVSLVSGVSTTSSSERKKARKAQKNQKARKARTAQTARAAGKVQAAKITNRFNANVTHDTVRHYQCKIEITYPPGSTVCERMVQFVQAKCRAREEHKALKAFREELKQNKADEKKKKEQQEYDEEEEEEYDEEEEEEYQEEGETSTYEPNVDLMSQQPTFFRLDLPWYAMSTATAARATEEAPEEPPTRAQSASVEEEPEMYEDDEPLPFTYEELDIERDDEFDRAMAWFEAFVLFPQH